MSYILSEEWVRSSNRRKCLIKYPKLTKSNNFVKSYIQIVYNKSINNFCYSTNKIAWVLNISYFCDVLNFWIFLAICLAICSIYLASLISFTFCRNTNHKCLRLVIISFSLLGLCSCRLWAVMRIAMLHELRIFFCLCISFQKFLPEKYSTYNRIDDFQCPYLKNTGISLAKHLR